jgi:hypothetical protein
MEVHTMARNRDPFTLALSSLRERLQSGLIRGGAPVIVQDEAERLRLSTTPVREALAHLSGEGLVERAPSGGYLAVRLDAMAARERYALQGSYVRIATECDRAALSPMRIPVLTLSEDDQPPVPQLFAALVRCAGNQCLEAAFMRVDAQLDVLRNQEALVFPDLPQEAADLFTAWNEGGEGDFEAAAGSYFKRRVLAAGALAALAQGHVGR